MLAPAPHGVARAPLVEIPLPPPSPYGFLAHVLPLIEQVFCQFS